MQGVDAASYGLLAQGKADQKPLPQRPINPALKLFRLGAWTAEIWFLLMATAMVCILAAVLYKFDGQPFDAWPQQTNFSLNSFISLMTTIFWLMLTAPATSLAQLRWNQYGNDKVRSLHDFELVDQASRGIWGCLALLLRRPRLDLASASALLVIGIAAVNPLVQSILDFDTVIVPTSGQATLPIANLSFAWPADLEGRALDIQTPFTPYNITYSDVSLGSWSNDGSFAAMYGGVFSGERIASSATGTCPEANCTWPEYSSLVLQTRCTNLTDQLQLNKDLNATWLRALQKWWAEDVPFTTVSNTSLPADVGNVSIASLPNGFSLSVGDILGVEEVGAPNWTYPNEVGIYNGAQPILSLVTTRPAISGENRTGTVLLMHAIYMEYNDTWHSFDLGRGFASECSIEIVAQPYQSNFTSGLFMETKQGDAIPSNEVAEDALGPRDITLRLLGEGSLACDINSNGANTTRENALTCGRNADFRNVTLDYPRFPSQGKYLGVDPYTVIVLGNMLTRLFYGTTVGNRATPSTPISPIDNLRAAIKNSLDPDAAPAGTSSGSGSSSGSGNAKTLQQPAFEDVMANVAQSLTNYMRAGAGTSLAGTALASRVVYLVHWEWIALPAVLVLLSLLLLLTVAADTRQKRVPTRTDSAVAAMLYGVRPGAATAGLLCAEDKPALDKAARRLRVRLDGSGFLRPVES